jgi:hypothetical protein
LITLQQHQMQQQQQQMQQQQLATDNSLNGFCS